MRAHIGYLVVLHGKAVNWSPRQESNLYLTLRRHPFYPLNYEELVALAIVVGA
jgi:hypothetical protein